MAFGNAAIPVTNGKRFGDSACFDIVSADDDMRWCVKARGNRMDGPWSQGGQGGPLLAGAGAGTRLFGIKGDRVLAKPAPRMR